MFKLSSLYAMLASALGVSATPERTYRNSRPTGAALRNPADPIQTARIEAAAVKRARRADKLHRHACTSRHFNVAHHSWVGPFPTNRPSFTLDPLLVAK